MSKRSFGTVRRLPSGRWQARYRHPSTGRMAAAPHTFDTKGDATRWLSATETDLGRGLFVAPGQYDVSLREYAEHWLEHRALRPRTGELYRGLLDLHILPTLGNEQLDQLSPIAIRKWHGALLKAGRPGPVTVAKAYRLLSAILKTAVDDELLVRNPCRIKGAASERSIERSTLSIAQVESLAQSIDDRYRAMVLLAVWCGLRLGELLALTRGDVDQLHGVVSVDKAAAELKCGERVVGPPKTAAGVRRVTIPPHVLGDVRRHLDVYTGPAPAALVFVGTKGQPVRRASFYTAWNRAVSATGLEGFRFHDLRHTGATLAAVAGATTRELMARYGHASPSAALRYQHATAERDATIAKALSSLVDHESAHRDRSQPDAS